MSRQESTFKYMGSTIADACQQKADELAERLEDFNELAAKAEAIGVQTSNSFTSKHEQAKTDLAEMLRQESAYRSNALEIYMLTLDDVAYFGLDQLKTKATLEKLTVTKVNEDKLPVVIEVDDQTPLQMIYPHLQLDQLTRDQRDAFAVIQAAVMRQLVEAEWAKHGHQVRWAANPKAYAFAESILATREEVWTEAYEQLDTQVIYRWAKTDPDAAANGAEKPC